METYTGKSILKRIAIGKMRFYSKGEQMVQRRTVSEGLKRSRGDGSGHL